LTGKVDGQAGKMRCSCGRLGVDAGAESLYFGPVAWEEWWDVCGFRIEGARLSNSKGAISP